MRRIVVGLVLLISASAHANISLSKTYISFYGVKVGGYGPTDYVYVYNLGRNQANVFISDSCSSDYYISGFCGLLQPGGSCQISVQFNPRTPGSSSCSININAGAEGFSTVFVNGQAER